MREYPHSGTGIANINIYLKKMAHGGRMLKKKYDLKGFTLIELLIVIAIIGIVAAIAIPNLLVAFHKGKQKATMGDMRTIGTAIDSYITDNFFAPGFGSISLVSGLGTHLIPFHTRTIPIQDGWGGNFRFESGAAGSGREDFYSVISYGRDSTSGTIDTNNNHYLVTAIFHFDNDMCYSNGNFTYGPKTK
jgi:general secretion pathway protein G